MDGGICVEKKKICLLGAFAVGKTSLIQRFVNDRFGDKYLTTIGVDISQKLLAPFDSGNGRMCQYHLLIWDIAGMDRFDKVVESYYRGAAGALAVADLTRENTASDLTRICRNFRTVCPTVGILFIGNKADLHPLKGPVSAVLEQVAESFGGQCRVTSAKTGAGVAEAFQLLAETLEKGLDASGPVAPAGF